MNILQLADKSLGKYGQDSPSQAGEFLFGPGFTKHLQDKVDSDASLAKVVLTSQRYHPYGNTSRATTIGRSKVFSRGPCRKLEVTAGQSSHLNTAKPLQRPGLDKAKVTLPIISPIEEVLNQLPSPLTAFTLLDLDVSLITTPVGGRLPLFIHNWEILTKDPWVLTTVRGYHLPLCQWPTQEAVPVTFMLDSKKEEALAEEISNLEVKEQ